ncbi:MAG: hypothetical protein AAF171_19175 [Cyanobacteria bacterium P01_A01_bin.116]
MASPFSDDAPSDEKLTGKFIPSSVASVANPALWLLGLFAIALFIRFTNLTAKAAWGDEVSTILFSLGNTSRMMPLNEVVSLDAFLRPLQVTASSTPLDAATNLLAENNHPPAYFALAHVWMSLLRPVVGLADGYASLWSGRALSAIFGALGVPATYLLAWFSFRSVRIGLLCAGLMAVSPFGVFLAQEARHYTLAILMVIASLSCFVLAFQALKKKATPSWTTMLLWVLFNGLSITVHYFCGITIVAEALVLLVLLIQHCREDGAAWRRAAWVRVYVAAVGTFVGAALWLPVLLNFYGSPQTTFLKTGVSSWKYWVNPLVQSLAGWLYAVLSPVTSGYSWQAVTVIVVSCVLVLGLYTPWLVWHWVRSLKFQYRQPALRPGLQAIGGFFIVANLLFLLICYGAGFDITRGHRYSFVFFPSILILVGAGIAAFLPSPVNEKLSEESLRLRAVSIPFLNRSISGKAFIATVLCVGFLGSQVIVNNFTYLKFYKADRLIDLIQAESAQPAVIGASTFITEQPIVVGIEILSVGWEIQRRFNPAKDNQPAGQRWVAPPRFVMAETNPATGVESVSQLKQALSKLSTNYDLWLLTGFAPDLAEAGCEAPIAGNKGSYTYHHYVCSAKG